MVLPPIFRAFSFYQARPWHEQPLTLCLKWFLSIGIVSDPGKKKTDSEIPADEPIINYSGNPARKIESKRLPLSLYLYT